MATYLKTGKNSGRLGQQGSFSKTLVTSLVILAVIGLIGFWGLSRVEKEMKANLENQLLTSLDSTVKILRGWAQERVTLIEVAAANPDVRNKILSLVNKTSRNKKIDPDNLRNLAEQKWLRKHLGRITKKYEFTGFVVIDKSGLQVAALLDGPVGKRNLIESSNFVQRALNGTTVISVPFMSNVPLPDRQGVWHETWPTLFVATPITNSDDEVVAVLSFRLRPENEFTLLLEDERIGTSEETYAFSDKGLLISKSRFEPQLKSIGLIPDSADSISLLNVEIRDPGGNMTTGYIPETPRTEQPLTRMAQSALQQASGVDVDGYNDYRGVPVVGAWTWLEDLNFGITHEIDTEEAFTPLATLDRIFLIIYALLLGAAGLGLLQYHRKQKAEEEKQWEHQQTIEVGRRMQSIFSNTIDGIIIMNETGTIESFNPAAEQIFGYSPKEIIGQNVNLLMPELYQSEDGDFHKSFTRSWTVSIVSKLREVVGIRKDGETIFLEMAGNAVELESGKKFTGIIRDITERKQIEHDVELARQEAETASKAKTQFLSQMSHELRTPMNAILGFAQIMDAEPESMDKAARKDCVDHILKAGKHLLALINEILDLSRIETGKLAVELEPVELAPMIREVLALSKVLTSANQVSFIDHISDSAGHTVRADRMRLRQVLLNLVSNAVKYNREKGTVTLSCETHGEHHLRISVTDTGQGISEEDQKVLFQPFSRLQNDVTTVEGTGIGLTISQLLMELMKGDIHVESESGVGSTFTIELPLSTAPMEQAEEDFSLVIPQLPEAERLSGVHTSILYIEDKVANMYLIKQILENHRPEVELLTTPRGRMGLDMAKETQPDLILLDVNLPGMSGLEVFIHLQQSEATRHIPVVVISANALESDIAQARELGIRHYLTKPINIPEFLRILDQYLSPASASTPKPSEPEKDTKPRQKKSSGKGKSSGAEPASPQ